MLVYHADDPGSIPANNARPYYALIARQFLAQNNADALPCPAVSPDPIHFDLNQKMKDFTNKKMR